MAIILWNLGYKDQRTIDIEEASAQLEAYVLAHPEIEKFTVQEIFSACPLCLAANQESSLTEGEIDQLCSNAGLRLERT